MLYLLRVTNESSTEVLITEVCSDEQQKDSHVTLLLLLFSSTVDTFNLQSIVVCPPRPFTLTGHRDSPVNMEALTPRTALPGNLSTIHPGATVCSPICSN
ncbi:Hypothetical protein SMAX5B_008413 [Scophthalmus maximus]|uniref:Uncharacterized protein n=1 Tax=Scophthalmus maximus TaxID=52904 RepID=A0A2U9B3I4_SCOMX|nr:Hypothetical protein SMAX5B_008413 [Scophthalmus maximus]